MSLTTPGSDPVYKRLCAFPEVVEDLLRSLFPDKTLDAADWASLGRLPASYVSDDFRQRHGDAVWRVRLRPGDGRGEWLYVLVLLEFQSTTDDIMALRVLQYTAMLYHELLREGAAKPGRLPPVLPVVLYNGQSKWRAAREVRELIADPGTDLAQYQPSQRHVVLDERHSSADDTHLRRLTRAFLLLEQSRSPEHLAEVARRLRDWLGSAGNEELKRAFADWLWVLWRRLDRGRDEPAAPPPELTLEYLCCKQSLSEPRYMVMHPVDVLEFRRGLGAGFRCPRSAGGWRRRRRPRSVPAAACCAGGPRWASRAGRRGAARWRAGAACA